ncbi:TetR/AcrR family transcriptional regulator C-terminal ligand-binding domain-containing protein [Mycolicibacterium sp. 050232]|uniref:TetR/AcrR family transcriptional regulator n=1 Tax=Mycolicibacterium sp. 050232 TaxID=3113982 RepID=UPI002E2949A2|nr:TetR/AcrR family transcriptional regulator C-terminal ligand-binding domain-containing protein [Mycolicibacterium sp. 050232]MED5811014.1 TetR/AcrR family transcriptional regulator C-terminal ligand-binding domain-containing protein [Mycolicibacterium sp. 050232]
MEGVIELPVSEVAERSGVNRGTIYRWWPTSTDLLTDAVAFHWDYRMEPPNTGSWEGDVRWVMTEVSDLAGESVERAIMVAVATGQYPAFNELIMDAWRGSLPQWFAMVERAVTRGEVRPDVDPYGVLTLMMTPFMAMALLGGMGTSDPQRLESMVSMILRATVADGLPLSGH